MFTLTYLMMRYTTPATMTNYILLAGLSAGILVWGARWRQKEDQRTAMIVDELAALRNEIRCRSLVAEWLAQPCEPTRRKDEKD